MRFRRESLDKPGRWLAGAGLLGSLSVGVAFAAVTSKSGRNLLWILLWVCVGSVVLGVVFLAIAHFPGSARLTAGACGYRTCGRPAPSMTSREWEQWTSGRACTSSQASVVS